MSEPKGINLRYLTQGMIKLGPDQLPENFFTWDRTAQIKWVEEYWLKLTWEDLLAGIQYLGEDEDFFLDCIEVEDEDQYPILAKTPAWQSFMAEDSQILEPVEERS